MKLIINNRMIQLIACDIHVRHEKKSQKDEISCCDWLVSFPITERLDLLE